MNTQILKYANNAITVALAITAFSQHALEPLQAIIPNLDTVHILAVTLAVRAILALIGDLLDDGIINGSFKVIGLVAFSLGAFLFGGCTTAQVNDGIRAVAAAATVYAELQSGQPITIPSEGKTVIQIEK